MFWSFVTTSWDTLWHMWLLIKWPRLLLNFCGKATSQSLEYRPSSWVTEEPPLRATSSMSCASSWTFRWWELCHTTPRPMDRWNKSIKCWCRWLGNWVRIGRQTGLSISQSWCMLTTLHDWLSPGTAPHYLMFGQWPCLAIDFYFPTDVSRRKMPVCWSLHCWLTWVTVQNLQRSASTVFIWGWKAEVILWLQGQMPFHWNQVTWSGKSWWLQREYNGERPVEGETMWSGMPDCKRCPFIPHEKPVDQTLMSPPLDLTSSHHPIMGAPLCSGVWTKWTRCATTVLEEPTQRVSENEKVPQSAKCLLPAWHQTGETSLGLVNRKLHAFLRMFSRASLPDQGCKKFNVEGRGYADINVSTLDVEVLITPMKLERSDWSWFPESHCSSF